MKNDDSSSAEAARDKSRDSQQSVEQCLKMVMTLSANDLNNPQIRSGLSSIITTIQSLLDHSLGTHQRKQRADAEKSSRSGAEQMNPTWRGRVRTAAEKNEKKTRLEKREAILRDLRSRVSQFKSQQNDNDSEEDNFSFSDFEARQQRASFWPEGSLDWARQLLGIELWMTESEKRQCYLQMVKICHPDQNQSVPTDAIQRVNAAWDIVRK